jgi:hypothetical protein
MAQEGQAMKTYAFENVVPASKTFSVEDSALLRVGRSAPGVYLTSEAAMRYARTLRWLMGRMRGESLTPEMRVLHVTAVEGLLELLEAPQHLQSRVAGQDE